ncbi:MAG: hypothetical protein L0H73_00505 [Nitrococcus sp.]|nr:hypothetical protein [Nitrococcus sp.]
MKDRGSYKLEFHPVLDGRPCPYVVVEGPLAKQVAGLALIREDLQAVKAVLARIDPHTEDFVGNKALLFGAVSLYGKCFTQADGRGVKLDPKHVFANSDERESHDRLIQLRHEYVSHGGKAREEQLKIILLLDPDDTNKRFRGLVGHGASAHGLDQQARDECLATVSHVEAYVDRALKRATETLSTKLVAAGENWAYEHAIWPGA